MFSVCASNKLKSISDVLINSPSRELILSCVLVGMNERAMLGLFYWVL